MIIPPIEPLISSSHTGWSATSAGVAGISASLYSPLSAIAATRKMSVRWASPSQGSGAASFGASAASSLTHRAYPPQPKEGLTPSTRLTGQTLLIYGVVVDSVNVSVLL